MKLNSTLIASFIVGLGLVTLHAQTQGPPSPSLSGAIAKLFGENSDFTATMDFHFTRSGGNEITMPGKMAHTGNKSRFDMDLANMQGGNMPPQAMARMKQMGMDSMYTITLLDKKITYIVYPNMKAYVENPMPAGETNPENYKADATKVGNETIDGHDCVKNNVVMTGPDGVQHKATVWNASDLKQFPIKIESATDSGDSMVMHFKDVKLGKPDAAQFEPPTDYTKYDTMMNLMMSRYRGAGGPQ
jgi:hypothetical protein